MAPEKTARSGRPSIDAGRGLIGERSFEKQMFMAEAYNPASGKREVKKRNYSCR